ncbi:hypothetical protein ABIB50_002245 [Mucilaginibacter sp. UYCu711]
MKQLIGQGFLVCFLFNWLLIRVLYNVAFRAGFVSRNNNGETKINGTTDVFVSLSIIQTLTLHSANSSPCPKKKNSV